MMTEAQIKHMVNRFLGWPLPKNFNPDGGINFEPKGNKGTEHEYVRSPSGTNLLTGVQADEMVRFMLRDLPDEMTDEDWAKAIIIHLTGRPEDPTPMLLKMIADIRGKKD